MTTEVGSMFEQLQNSFNRRATSSGGGNTDILRFEKNKDYIVRLLPYVKDAENSIFPFKFHGWTSYSTGNYVEFLDPSMVGKPNPIKKFSFENWEKVKNNGKEDAEYKKAKKLFTQDGWLVNCYVISDPTNEENEGTVKILRFGKQLHDIVDDHFQGERKDEFGVRIFDLTEKGCNFKIRVGTNDGGFKNYEKSYFMNPSEIEGVSDNEARIKEIWDECFDLTAVYPIKEYDELKEALSTHFLGGDSETSASDDDQSEGDDDSPSFSDLESLVDEGDKEEVSKPKEEPKKKKEEPKEEKAEESDDIDALLAGL